MYHEENKFLHMVFQANQFGVLQQAALSEILMIVLCAMLAGADNFMEIEQWAKAKIDFLRRLLPFKKGIPSHDTLNDVMNALPHKAFSKCFRSWVASLRKLIPDFIAVDGKTSRRAHNKDNGQPPLHLVSAWASRQRLVLGQQACEAKSNEITAIPQLLELLELAGALVRICQQINFTVLCFY